MTGVSKLSHNYAHCDISKIISILIDAWQTTNLLRKISLHFSKGFNNLKKLTIVKEVLIPCLISIDFGNFTSLFAPLFLFRLSRYTKQSRQCFIGYPNTSNFDKLIGAQSQGVFCCKETVVIF